MPSFKRAARGTHNRPAVKGKSSTKPTLNKQVKSNPSTSSSSMHCITTAAGSKKKRPRSESSTQEAADSETGLQD
jgi:hypothetical protein